jgi:hypothetical protein
MLPHEFRNSKLEFSYVCRATAPVAGIKRAAGGAPALQFKSSKSLCTSGGSSAPSLDAKNNVGGAETHLPSPDGAADPPFKQIQILE